MQQFTYVNTPSEIHSLYLKRLVYSFDFNNHFREVLCNKALFKWGTPWQRPDRRERQKEKEKTQRYWIQKSKGVVHDRDCLEYEAIRGYKWLGFQTSVPHVNLWQWPYLKNYVESQLNPPEILASSANFLFLHIGLFLGPITLYRTRTRGRDGYPAIQSIPLVSICHY